MKISLNWLNDFLPVSQEEAAVEALVHDLAMLGFEVESRESVRRDLSGVIAARITGIEPHPDADKLRLVTVDRGEEGPQTVVCGAPNVALGKRVPYACLGAKLPGLDKPLKKAKIRGVVSEGMLCSDVELGLSEDHSGLLELDDSWKAGECLDERLGLCDTMLDIDITQNRGDAFSIVGIARELAALRGVELKEQPRELPEPSGEEAVKVSIEQGCAQTGAPRYAGLVLSHITVGDSPRWLRDRLEAVGLRAINNVVDITNYVMWETGHPVHAFDRREIRGNEIRVRFAKAGEAFTTLDGQQHELDGEHVLICDGERPVALGGIMGGENSMVAEDTSEVLLECACFDPVNIRMGSRRAGIQSDSARRFERGVDMDNVPEVLQRMARLMIDCCGAQVAGPIVDEYAAPRQRPEIALRPARVTALLGLDVPKERIVTHLRSLGIEVREGEGDTLLARSPSWRFDLEREVDLIEEVVRMEGYDQVPDQLLAGIPLDQPANASLALRNRVRDALVRLGFRQQCSYSMVSPDLLERFHPERPALRIRNPLAAEMSVMRHSLLPSLVECAVYNLNRSQEHVALFEIDREFHPDGQSETGCREGMMLCAVLAGRQRGADWQDTERRFGFHDLKARAEELLRELALKDLEWSEGGEGPWSANTLSASRKGRLLLQVGQIEPRVLAAQGCEEELFALQLDLEALEEIGAGLPQYRAFSRQPLLLRDLSLLVEDRHSAGAVREVLEQGLRKLLSDLRLFDIYRGEGVPEGRHSQSWSLSFCAPDRNLRDKDVDPLIKKTLARLKKELGVELRG